MPRFLLEFYEEEQGTSPVLRWLREEMTPTPSAKRQQREIAEARKRLRAFRSR